MFLPIIDAAIGGASTEPVSVIYPSQPTNWDATLERTVADLTNRRLPPSRILFVCPAGQHAELVSAFDAQKERLLERLRNTTHVVVAPYNSQGRADGEAIDLWQASGEPWPVTDEDMVFLATRYIGQISKRTKAFLDAPPGYQFRKLSGSTSAIFLRAGNMLREVDSINVYSHLLLRRSATDAPIETVYVDSSTVLSFAMALQRTIAFFSAYDPALTPSIENFHSYEDLSNLNFPADGRYLVIISASTSGDLAKVLVDSHGAQQSRIVHLIGAGHDSAKREFRDSCLYFRDLPVTGRAASLGDINIDGEEFIPSYGEPTAVSLTTKYIRKTDARRLKDSFYQNNLRLLSSGQAAGYESYSLFSISNASYTSGPSELNEWLVNRLVHDIPASISLIVHLADSMSEALAGRIVQKLPQPSAVEMISIDDVKQSNADLSRDNSILVVANEDPNLEGFVRASTTLRKWPHAFRHFVLGHAFPETMATFRSVENSLRMRAGDRRYGWSTFAVMAVGRLDQHMNSLFDYPVDLKSALRGPTEIQGCLAGVLEAYSDDSRHVFLPKMDGNWMELRSGSVFFEGEYENLSDETIYLAVAIAVQRMREGGHGEPRLFDSNPFVGSVIDPQMFSRFSDGILQAALLRCLNPSELDFSRSAVMSRQMRELFVTVIRNSTNVVGEAALEFMAALAARKISLTPADHEIVCKSIKTGNADLAQVWETFTEETPI